MVIAKKRSDTERKASRRRVHRRNLGAALGLRRRSHPCLPCHWEVEVIEIRCLPQIYLADMTIVFSPLSLFFFLPTPAVDRSLGQQWVWISAKQPPRYTINRLVEETTDPVHIYEPYVHNNNTVKIFKKISHLRNKGSFSRAPNDSSFTCHVTIHLLFNKVSFLSHLPLPYKITRSRLQY